MQASDTESPLITDLPLQPALSMAANALGFEFANEVQVQTLPSILAGHDVMVSAATGSGKTLAFLLPTIQRLLDDPIRAVGALILTPTRELAQQIFEVCQPLCQPCGLSVGLIIGAEDFKKQQRLLRNKTNIIVATPGRLLEHLVLHPNSLAKLQLLILDEADRMLDMGFSETVLGIVAKSSAERQTLLFSATLQTPVIKSIATKVLRQPVTITLNGLQDEPLTIQQQIIPCDEKPHKLQVLTWLLQHEVFDKAIVFTNTKLQAEQLQGPLRGQKLRVNVLHGDMEQEARKQVMDLFRSGTINILLSTDLAGRGLDIEGVELVINFEVPRNGHQYAHRIGRTGRNGKQGLAITLVNVHEWNLMAGIERYIQQSCRRRLLEEVPSHFKGPKKMKASGKAVGSKSSAPAAKPVVKKIKKRERDTKNIGKRRQPSKAEATED